jgi:hypothetical protein
MFAPLVTNQKAKAASPSLTSGQKGFLQRKCACGGTLGPTGECKECQRNWLSPQHNSWDSKLKTRNPNTAQSHDQEAAPLLGVDFTKIPVFPLQRANQAQALSPATKPPPPETVQPKLAIGAVNDPLESEADAMAERVMKQTSRGTLDTRT